MIFDPLVKAWNEGAPAIRAESSLELRNLSGLSLGWNRSSQESNLILFGDGTLHHYQRGDFGERGNQPPGLWRGSCEQYEVEEIWKALEGLTEKDFEGRVADPGEGVTQLQAQCAGLCVILTWGPGELGLSRPGVEALAPLRRLVSKAESEILWNLRMEPGKAERIQDGISIPLDFSNDGLHPLSILLSSRGLGVEFTFRYAVDESDEEGPALQIDWMDAEVLLPEESILRMAEVSAGEKVRINTHLSIPIPAGVPHLGRFSYSQLTLGERVAGLPVFAGLAYTGTFKFQLQP